jgi:hypothetical protein
LSSEQQQLYDPSNFSGNFLAHPWSGFSIGPAINASVPANLTNWLDQWINLTISVSVGGEWLKKSTTKSNNTVIQVDTPDACASPGSCFFCPVIFAHPQP